MDFNEDDRKYMNLYLIMNAIFLNMDAEVLLKEMRSLLAPLNEKILNHPYIIDAEKGTLPLARIQAFVANQHYIVNNDVRNLALMLSRSTSIEELRFFERVMKADLEALGLVVKMARTLGFTVQELENYVQIPEAVVYAHYLSTLAQFSSPGEQVMALIINLPVWSSNCRRLSKVLREKYQIEETSFLDLFSSPTEELEIEALRITDHYLPEKEESMRRVARLIQAYELMFWDGLYRR